MIKGFLNVLVALVFSLSAWAQVEVVPLTQNEASPFDKVDGRPLPKVVVRTIPDSVVKALQKDEAFWYANANLAKKEKEANTKQSTTAWLKQPWVRILFWVLFIGGFAAVLIWYLSTLNIKLFRQTAKAISRSDGENITENIFTIAYEKEIGKAIAAQNFRQAVRLYYLQTLSLLSAKGLIQFQQDRTNLEYALQLYNTAAYDPFRQLTRSFEYTNYGKFYLTRNAFEKVQKDFETFYRQYLS